MPADIEKELRNLYLGLCELLRHFWLSFPPTTPNLEQKAIRMHEALQRYHAAKLKPFEVNLIIKTTKITSCTIYLTYFTVL